MIDQTHPYLNQDRTNNQQFTFQKPAPTRQYMSTVQIPIESRYTDDHYVDYPDYEQYREPYYNEIPSYPIYREPVVQPRLLSNFEVQVMPPLVPFRDQYRSLQQSEPRIEYPEFPFKEAGFQDLVDKALIDLALHEKNIEECKIRVFSREDFRLSYLFQMIDRNGTDQIIAEELSLGFKQFGIEAQVEDIQLLLDNYGRQNMFDFQLFCQMIYPLSKITTECEADDNVQMFAECKLPLKSLFASLLNCECAIEQYRNELHGGPLQESYQIIFHQDHFNDLKNYLYQKGQYFDKVIIQAVFKRFDRNNTGFITEQEFLNFWIPRLA